MAVDSRIPLIFLPLAAAFCFLSYIDSLVDDQAALRWWAQAEVEAGVAHDEVPEVIELARRRNIFTPRRLWRGLATRFMLLIGWFHRPAGSTVFEAFSLGLQATDAEGKFCRKALDYCWRWRKDWASCESPQVRATGTDIHDFVQACRHVYRDLGEEERTLLDPYRAAGAIPLAVLTRDPDNSRLDKQHTRGPGRMDGQRTQGMVRLPESGTEGKRLSREGLIKVLNESLRASALSESVPSPPREVVNIFSTFDLREVPTIPSDWAEVGRAVRDSRIVRFDSTPLLPRELFNMSMEQLALNEGPAAERIPVLPAFCAPMSLKSYAAFAQRHVQSGKRSAFTFAHWKLFGLEQPPEVPRSIAEHIGRSSLEATNAGWCNAVNVNVRRLPSLFSRLPHRLDRALGLEEEILRVQPFLWLGAVETRIHHHDEDSSVYVQLSGHTDVFLFPQSQTDVWGSHSTHVKHLTLNDPLLRMVPLFLVHLRPGDGLVFPGRSYHDFCGQSSDRIAMSFFLQPKWRKMEFSKDGWYTREAGKELGLEHLALRQLFLRSLIRLYEETGKGIIFWHLILELL